MLALPELVPYSTQFIGIKCFDYEHRSVLGNLAEQLSLWKSWSIAFREVLYLRDEISLGLIRALSRQSKDVIAYSGNRIVLMTLG